MYFPVALYALYFHPSSLSPSHIDLSVVLMKAYIIMEERCNTSEMIIKNIYQTIVKKESIQNSK